VADKRTQGAVNRPPFAPGLLGAIPADAKIGIISTNDALVVKQVWMNEIHPQF
jgi:hypothetical protein